MHWGDGDWSWWGWFVMTALMIGFWGLVVWLIVSLVRPGEGSAAAGSAGSGAPPAEEVLARRFANGEIDDQEYRARLDALRSTRAGAGRS